MNMKIVDILVCMLLILSPTSLAFISFSSNEQQMNHQCADATLVLLSTPEGWMNSVGEPCFDESQSVLQPPDHQSTGVFEYDGGWDSGSQSGPDLWHQTSVDAWSGNSSMGCFNTEFRGYENNMDLNYVITNETFSIEGAIEMTMTYYCKYITEDSDDFWGIVLYDPTIDYLCGFGSLYGYYPAWMHNFFDIKTAYEYCYQEGLFRNSDGSRSYDFRIGFAFIKTDSIGVTNTTAESHGLYWSGIFIDAVTISRFDTNDPPKTPAVPSGPDVGIPGISYVFSTVTSDSEGDKIIYGWDWNEDGVVDEWTALSASNSPVSISHSFLTTGTYYIKVKAMDETGEVSDFSRYKMVVITNKPNKPVTPIGEQEGKSGHSYWYSTSTVDPDGDQVAYFWEWGDGSDSGWLERYHSGDNCAMTHTWTEQGTYSIKVKARDIHGVESDWSDPLPITMPYSYDKPVGSFLEFLWQRFLHAFPMLQPLRGF